MMRVFAEDSSEKAMKWTMEHTVAHLRFLGWIWKEITEERIVVAVVQGHKTVYVKDVRTTTDNFLEAQSFTSMDPNDVDLRRTIGGIAWPGSQWVISGPSIHSEAKPRVFCVDTKRCVVTGSYEFGF